MAFTYSSDCTTDRDRTRLLVADTVDDGHLFEDGEVDAALDMRESPFGAAAMLIRSAAVNKARRAVMLRSMDVDLDDTKALQFLLKVADRLDEQDGEGGGVDWAEMVTTPAGKTDRWLQLYGKV